MGCTCCGSPATSTAGLTVNWEMALSTWHSILKGTMDNSSSMMRSNSERCQFTFGFQPNISFDSTFFGMLIWGIHSLHAKGRNFQLNTCYYLSNLFNVNDILHFQTETKNVLQTPSKLLLLQSVVTVTKQIYRT
jgi:hypothetical protein